MKKQYAQLYRIDHNVIITEEDNYGFLFHLQSSLLLALKEQGILNVMQYRHAEERLQQQRRDRAKDILKKGDSNDQSSQLLSCIYR